MAKLNQTFNAKDVEPTTPYDPIPAGDYPMMITESVMRQTNDKTGEYLELTCEVLDGEFKGRKVWERLNLVNKSQKAVEISHRRLSEISRAVGVMEGLEDSAQLHDRPFIGTVKMKPADNAKGYDASNEMKAFKSYEGGTVQTPSAPAAQQQSDVPAWAKK